MIVYILFLAFTAIVTGKTFRNDGDLHGWDDVFFEHKGSVEVKKNEHYNSTHGSAIRFTQTYDPDYYGRYHSEVQKQKAARLGDTGYYGFAFKLANNWEFDDMMYTISQFIADFEDWDCGIHHKEWSPTTMTYLMGQELYSRVRYGDICNSNENIHIFKVGTVKAGQWHTVVIGANWQSKKTGFFRVWFDGMLAVDEQNLETTPDIDKRFLQFRVGLYASGWFDPKDAKPGQKGFYDKIPSGHQRTRNIWHDKITVFGDSYEEADPHQW